MKINKAIIILTLCVFGCKNKSKLDHPLNDSLKKDTVITSTTIVKDTSTIDPSDSNNNEEIYHADSVNFEKFALDAKPSTVKAPIDWSSYPEAKDFKTRITEAYTSNEVSFAGNYVLARFGCGASCIMGFMVDVRDGKIYDLPLGEENSCSFAEDRAICKTNSRLFISSICKEKPESTKVYYLAYLWNEDKKEFNSIKNEDEFLKK
ncbi:hypothetical protein [Pedobacter paludis]|uniref:Uncharacterized protein n=1 Tax=Pedobacter paludis TaxID=2203212 RepID=A0A317F1L0_9SPHI|nr:hypothetical protein [Pedobacter paludis]PWS32582.1 hypothetical protein DF947_05770 [Pedobacter paludis]